MPIRRMKRPIRRRPRRQTPQVFRENGAVAIKAQESYTVGANAMEIPLDRSFRAMRLSLHLTAMGPMLVQVELWAPANRPVWRSAPISVGVIPIRRTFRWPTSAAAMWPSGSSDTIFKIVTPCPGKQFASLFVSVNYTIVLHLSADYDQQICPKTHGSIESLIQQTQMCHLSENLSETEPTPLSFNEHPTPSGESRVDNQPEDFIVVQPTLACERRASIFVKDTVRRIQALVSESDASNVN